MNALQGIGSILVIIGVVALIWGIYNKMRAGRVAGAPLIKTGDAASKGAAAAGEKGAASIEGAVACAQPLTSPVTGTPCLYYELRVTKSWKEGEAHKTKELVKEHRAASFTIDDGSGPVPVDATEGGDFEPMQTKTETKGTGIMGGITGQELVFGNYNIETASLTLGSGLKFTVEEKVLPIVPKMYACGKASDGGGPLTKPSWRQLILSNKSRDEILGAAAQGAKIFLPAGAGGMAVGIVLGIVGNMVASNDKAAQAAENATAAAASATAAANITAKADTTAGTTATANATQAAATAAASAKPTPGHPAPVQKK
jgi:hypothetical protein